jgi:hypothetical protein
LPYRSMLLSHRALPHRARSCCLIGLSPVLVPLFPTRYQLRTDVGPLELRATRWRRQAAAANPQALPAAHTAAGMFLPATAEQSPLRQEPGWDEGMAVHGDGRYARILRGLTSVQLLILDDWGLEPLDSVPVVTSAKSSRNATDAARPSSPARSRRKMAGLHRRPDRCRRHPRPPRSQRPSHRSRRRQPQTQAAQINPKD